MTKSEQSGKPVVSQFFSKSSPLNKGGAAAPKASNSLKKHPSIISLSSSDGADDNDDEIEVLEGVPPSGTAAAPSSTKKRKASSINESSKENGSSKAASSANNNSSKKVKVAPLFERVKNAGSSSSSTIVKKEDDTETVLKLQQWKFAAGPASDSHSTPVPTTRLANGTSTSPHSSSPLPDVPTANPAVDARRAQVRKMLLGIDTEWRRPPDDEAEASAAAGDSADQMGQDVMSEDDDEPVASTSKLPAHTKGKSSKKDKVSNDAPDFSKFASTAGEAKGKKSKTAKADKADQKGKGKEVEPAVKYTPLEQQVLDIKKRYVSVCHYRIQPRESHSRYSPYASQPDTLLIVEVGYKFKFFGEDAKIAAKELNIGEQHILTLQSLQSQ